MNRDHINYGSVKDPKAVPALHRQLSWPEFWHEFGNKFPIKSKESHMVHEQISIKGHSCFHCALDSLEDKLLFGDGGVKVRE